ncbi:MAG: amidohydrolase family protein, partial [Gammaproteobacteria bacterium]|nr:amidohydrolase family protein [Gammaproteobacteria bacterium]
MIKAGWIIPVIPKDRVLENYALVLQGEKIAGLLPAADVNNHYSAEQTLDLPDHVLIPGLINTHGHAAMTLLRGYADDKELMNWLNNYIWPVEGAHVDASFVEDGTSLAVAEMIRTGTTCAADTYFFPDAAARAFQKHNFRAQICMPVVKFGNAWARDEMEHIHKGLAVHDEYRSSELITSALAPHSPYTVTDDGFRKILTYAEELQIPVHLHLHETAAEIEESIRATGRRPIA